MFIVIVMLSRSSFSYILSTKLFRSFSMRTLEQGKSIFTCKNKSSLVNSQTPMLVSRTGVLVGVRGFSGETTDEFYKMTGKHNKTYRSLILCSQKTDYSTPYTLGTAELGYDYDFINNRIRHKCICENKLNSNKLIKYYLKCNGGKLCINI